jgi:flagellar biosynthesis protein FliQ
MEIIISLIVVVSPWLVKHITGFIKKIGAVGQGSNRDTALRATVAVLSLVIAIINAVVTGTNDFDASLVNEVLTAIATFVASYYGAQGIYHVSKEKGNE